jgi:hypothetical protein
VHQPAPNWLLLPVILLYGVAVIFIGQAVWEVVPVTGLAFSAGRLEDETAEFQSKNSSMRKTLKKAEDTKEYVSHKEKWASQSIGGGDLMMKMMSALPRDVKLRGMTYTYEPPTEATGTGVVAVNIQVKGTYEAARIGSALERVDGRLGLTRNEPELTEEGMNIMLEYRTK